MDDRLAWERIKHMISLTILMQANSIPESAKQCIELYGFDIILDKKLKPWLLEVSGILYILYYYYYNYYY